MVEAHIRQPFPVHFREIFETTSATLPTRSAAEASLAILNGFQFAPREGALFVEEVLSLTQSSDRGYETELGEGKDTILRSEPSIRTALALASVTGNHNLLGYWIRSARARGYRLPPYEAADLLATSYDIWARHNRSTLQTTDADETALSQHAADSLAVDTARVAVLRRAQRDILAEENNSQN